MRIATWNILGGRHPDQPWQDASAFAASVRSLDADLLGLQEVDLGQPRSGGEDLTKVAAEAMGAVAGRFVAALTGLPDGWRPADGTAAATGPAYGVAFLSRYPVTGWRTVRLPGTRVPVPYHWPGRRGLSLVRDEPRVAVVAEVQAPDGPLTVVTTHLSFLPTSNGRQLRRLMGGLERESGRLVVLGDLNMGSARAERLTELSPLATGATFPADAPSRQIDHVLARGVTATSGGPLRLSVSDHQALVARIP
ncbi:MAG: endonuclease/exonuclease/phosphatase family protein [Mycobacteriales bacterium]